jgi:hypothetical protein
MRFFVIILEPGRIWSDYAVVDNVRFVAIAKCTHQEHAEQIAAALNKCAFEKDALQLTEGE